jgi:hypothetical protein
MAKRRIKRKRGEGIAISGAATVRVSRGVTLLVNAARTARVDRLKKLPARPVAQVPGQHGQSGGESTRLPTESK